MRVWDCGLSKFVEVGGFSWRVALVIIRPVTRPDSENKYDAVEYEEVLVPA